jgi:thiamine kinase-like enzyme
MTIAHGDAHFWNVLLPIASRESPRIFDWDAWRVDLAASDLACMMSVYWFPDYRRRYEGPMLDHYHEQLLHQGVTGYDRPELQDDYRLSTLWRIMTPVGAIRGPHPCRHLAEPP